MKKNYLKPQIIVRDTRIKNYVICTSGEEYALDIRDQLIKDRNDDIWNSGDDEASVW